MTEPTPAVPGDVSWVYRRPSPTVVGSFRPDIVAAPGYRKPGDPPRQKTPGSVAIDITEAAVLQSYPTELEEENLMTNLVALDLFAGTGWGVACRWLGIEEHGVDNMPEVVATREANGMSTIFQDVWEGLLNGAEGVDDRAAYVLMSYDLLIASPPCQTFSMAGKGEGRKALEQVIGAIERGDYKDAERLHKLSEETDPRTALVLTPLAYAYRDRPTYIVLEQVPTVLPVWERIGEELRGMGYSVVVGNLQAEQYGVPQTRKRAILIARSDGVEAAMPVPTHSKYYPRDPKRLDEGVLPWVSMAEALGWGTTEKPSYTVTGGGASTGGAEPFGNGARQGMRRAQDEGDWALRSNYGTNGDPANRGERTQEQPAPTITSKADRNKWREVSSQSVAGGPRAERDMDDPALTVTQNSDRVRLTDGESELRLSRDEAAALQSYPPFATGAGSSSTVQPARSTEHPSPTVTGKATMDFHSRPGLPEEHKQRAEDARRVRVEEAATLQSYPNDKSWGFTDRPAPTQTGHGIATRQASGQQNVYRDAIEEGEFKFRPPHNEETARLSDDPISLSRAYRGDAINMEADEQALIQSYPALEWKGTKSKQFLMIGNAVPPLLAHAILRTLL